MKITLICNEYPPKPGGGIGTFVYTFAHGLKQAGHLVTVVGLGDSDRVEEDDGIRLVTLAQLKGRGFGDLLNRLKLHLWLRQEARAGRVDVIEVPDYQGMLPFGFSACPVVVRLHLSQTTITKRAGTITNPIVQIFERFNLQHRRPWIAVSQHALDLTRETFGLLPHRHHVIHYPIVRPMADSEAPAQLPHRFVLFAGTVSERKGVYALAEAARTFLQSDPTLHLVFVGPALSLKGVHPEARIPEIVGPELAPRILFLGRLRRDDVYAIMRRAAVFAFPSTLETFGLVVAESMLAGTPVITSSSGPFPEFVSDGKTGLLVPPDDPNALSDAIMRVLNDRGLAAELGRCGRQVIEESFSIERCVGSTVSLYRGLLETK